MSPWQLSGLTDLNCYSFSFDYPDFFSLISPHVDAFETFMRFHREGDNSKNAVPTEAELSPIREVSSIHFIF